jgi:two-component system chemotaxis response regulator CheB
MVRVLLIDRSAVGRVRLAELVSSEAEVRVLSTLAPRPGLVERVSSLGAHVVVIDVSEDDQAGLSTLRELRSRLPDLPVVVFSASVLVGSRVVTVARAAGAAGCLRRPAEGPELQRVVTSRLVPLLTAIARSSKNRRAPSTEPAPRPVRLAAAGPAGRTTVRAIVIGCSTGGPNALSVVLPRLPADLDVPVLVVQHMPPRFTSLLANRLDQVCPLDVAEATDGQLVVPGKVYLAPGGQHMRVGAVGGVAKIRLDQEPPVNSCRPSVDVMFASAVEFWGGAIAAAILTGMGQDGLEGARSLVGAGGVLLAQDEASSVVWGMPRVVVEAGLAAEVLTVDDIADGLVRLVRGVPAVGRGLAS